MDGTRDTRTFPLSVSRRAALAAMGAAVLPLLAACIDDDPRAQPSTTQAPFSGTPAANVPGFTDPRRWTGRTLRVGGWGGEIQAALRERVWTPFATATGCTVHEVVTDLSQLAASYQQNGEPYADVLLVDAFWASGALDRGEIEPVPSDRVDMSQYKPIAPIPGTAPAYAYAMVSAFRRDAVKQGGAPTSWQQWWDTSAFAGSRTLPKGPLGSFEFALLADGVPRDQLYPLDGARAIEKLRQISGSIVDLWWESGDQPVVWMSKERAQFAAAWHYRVIAGQQDGRAIDFVWDDGLLVADYWVMPKGSRSLDVAVDFLAFASTPEVQASLATAVPLGPVNPGAFQFIDPRTAARLPTAPENVNKLVPADVAWWATNDVEANERFNSWLLGVPMHE